jgi:hypothetical protein
MLTYAPRGQTPVLAETVTHDHLAVISGVTPQGGLFWQIYERPLTGAEVVQFLKHLERCLPGPLIVIWDGAPIHRGRLCKRSWPRATPLGSIWNRCPATRRT